MLLVEPLLKLDLFVEAINFSLQFLEGLLFKTNVTGQYLVHQNNIFVFLHEKDLASSEDLPADS
jgi:hypothetical protein